MKNNNSIKSQVLCIAILATIVLHCPLMVQAQNTASDRPLLIGDTAPRLRLDTFISGIPIDNFESGRIYVVDFWTTYCKPCIELMPHLAKLTKQYKDDLSVISVNVYQKRQYPKSRAVEIIDSLGKKVNFSVAFESGTEMQNTWLKHNWNAGVPKSFVVEKSGRIAWSGYPTDLDNVLKLIVNNQWNVDSARRAENRNYRLSIMDDSTRSILHQFYRSGSSGDFYGEPDSILNKVNELLAQQPDLKYTSNMVLYTFDALLKTNMKAAFLYAKEASNPANPQGAQYWPIILAIKELSDHLTISTEIYLLGAQLMERYFTSIPKNVLTTAEWYWLGGDKKKALKCTKALRKEMKKATTNNYGIFF